MDETGVFELIYDFIEKRFGTLAAWLVTLGAVGGFTILVIWVFARWLL